MGKARAAAGEMQRARLTDPIASRRHVGDEGRPQVHRRVAIESAAWQGSRGVAKWGSGAFFAGRGRCGGGVTASVCTVCICEQ
jgi:hypothetical protein